jgi:hypothetical protein
MGATLDLRHSCGGSRHEEHRDGNLRRRTCQPAAVSIYGELATAPPAASTLAAETLLLHAPAYGLVRDDQIETYRDALGDRLRIVEVPGLHMVQWDAFDEVAAAVEQLVSSSGHS